MKKILLSFLISVSGVLLNAQYGYLPGYIIKSNGDTLNGMVFYKSDGKLEKSCLFKRFDIAEPVEYNLSQLRAYGFDYGRHFESVRVGKRNMFLECVIAGRISLFIEPGKKKGEYYIKYQGSELIKLLPGKNAIEGIGEWNDFRGMLAYIMAGYPESELNNTAYNIESLSELFRKYNTQAGQNVRAYNLTPSGHLLGDFTVNKSKPYMDFGITGGYQYVLLQINKTKKHYLKAGDYYPSMRSVAGLYLSRNTSKVRGSVSYDISALFFKDTYYAYSAYGSPPYTYEDDILIGLTGIQIPAGLKIELSESKIKPYIKAGAMYTYLIDAGYKRIEEEFDAHYNTVYTSVDHYYNVTSDIGFHGAFGLEIPFGLARKIAFELMYQRDIQNLRNPTEDYWAKLFNHNLSIIMRVNL